MCRPNYHTIIPIDFSFQTDIKPSFDGYAFHKSEVTLSFHNNKEFLAFLSKYKRERDEDEKD